VKASYQAYKLTHNNVCAFFDSKEPKPCRHRTAEIHRHDKLGFSVGSQDSLIHPPETHVFLIWKANHHSIAKDFD
jgi:hypothetical protein